ncbi:MAG: GWxTD domain-containing protein [Candidatus Acidiferrum sp.]
MNFLHHFVGSPLAAAIGWTLLHSLWEGAILSGLLAAVLVLIRSPRIRYAAACAALAALVCAFLFTLAVLAPYGTGGSGLLNPASVPAWHVPGSTAISCPWPPNLTAIAPWLTPLWLLGVFLIYLHALAGCLSVQRLRRRGVCCAPERWQAELARLGALLGLSRAYQLLESSLAQVPMALGHFRPLILVPVGLLAGLPPSQVEVILLHELAHIRRCDYLVNALQRLAEGLLFYHPAVWWISNVMRAERENCCDDLVVSITGNPHEYALTLAALEQNRFSGPQPAVAVTGGRLMKRIHRLLYPRPRNTAWAPLLAAAILLTLGAVSIAAWQADVSPHGSSAVQGRAVSSKATDYSKWLNEDVVYIIDDAERAAFLSLSTGAERDKFIEQFWARRNPNPGSSVNKFKVEYYRRIAYADKRFATASGTPGWQTDRGHIYIVYGPPDEIDSHPKDEGGSSKPGIEVWTYRHVAGVGDNDTITFIDRTGRGDYHLAPGNAR